MKNVLLIGLGRFGRHLAMQLSELGHQVMAVDRDEERVNECMPFVTNAQIGDSTRVDFLRSLGVSNYDVCYVTISGDFQNSLETTSLLKELGAKYVVSRAERDVQAKFLLRNGADAVTYPEKQLAKWAAIRYTANHIFDYIELDEKHAIIEVAVPDSWQGHSIGELDIRRKYGVNILGVKRDGKTNVTILPETVLDGSLTLLVLGEYTALKKCFRLEGRVCRRLCGCNRLAGVCYAAKLSAQNFGSEAAGIGKALLRGSTSQERFFVSGVGRAVFTRRCHPATVPAHKNLHRR